MWAKELKTPLTVKRFKLDQHHQGTAGQISYPWGHVVNIGHIHSKFYHTNTITIKCINIELIASVIKIPIHVLIRVNSCYAGKKHIK